MRKKERYEKVIAWFQDNVPVAETELHYNNPYSFCTMYGQTGEYDHSPFV